LTIRNAARLSDAATLLGKRIEARDNAYGDRDTESERDRIGRQHRLTPSILNRETRIPANTPHIPPRNEITIDSMRNCVRMMTFLAPIALRMRSRGSARDGDEHDVHHANGANEQRHRGHPSKMP